MRRGLHVMRIYRPDAIVFANPDPKLALEGVLALVDRMGDAVERPLIAHVREDYVVYHIAEGNAADGARPLRTVIGELDLAPLLLGESRPLSDDARRELLPHRWFTTIY